MSCQPHREAEPDRAVSARNLIKLLTPLLMDEGLSSARIPAALMQECVASQISSHTEILSAIQTLVAILVPNIPIFTTFHDGQVHDPLGGGACAFQDDIIHPLLLAFVNDQEQLLANKRNGTDLKHGWARSHESGAGFSIQLLTRPIVVHAGVQPNNSPHVGTLVVLSYAFSALPGA